MMRREIQGLAAELAAGMRAEIEALPADHPMRRWLAAHDAAEARRQAAEARVAAAERAADAARTAELRRRIEALEKVMK
jgi:hypothetical protein